MNAEQHERARKLALTARIEPISEADRRWLEAHLAECAVCSEYAAGLAAVIAGVRSSVTAGEDLVAATRLRVRRRAAELRAQQQAMRPMWIACAAVVVGTFISTPLLWAACEWVAGWSDITASTWRLVFVFVWVTPAIAASILLAGLGVHRELWRERPMEFSVGES